jgi:hypothetical protein
MSGPPAAFGVVVVFGVVVFGVVVFGVVVFGVVVFGVVVFGVVVFGVVVFGVVAFGVVVFGVVVEVPQAARPSPATSAAPNPNTARRGALRPPLPCTATPSPLESEHNLPGK